MRRVDQIAAVCEQQANSNLQVSESVELISEVSSRSSEGVSQIAGAASRLNELAEQLRTVTSRFKLDASLAEELEMWNESVSIFKSSEQFATN